MKNIEQYIQDYSKDTDEILKQLYRETFLKVIHPEMIAGPYLGKFLEIISNIKKPEYILEIGTFTGYSTICLARGLSENGKIYTIEINDELQEIHEKYFNLSGLKNKIVPLYGDAKEIISKLNINFDLIFIDGSKREYPLYYKLVFPKLNKNGLIIADNVLWYGNVLKKETSDKDSEGIKKFNEMVKNDNRVDNILINVRDGIMLIIKK